MTTTTFGEVSWTDDVFGGQDGKRVNSKDLFLRLGEGANEMRLVTQPFQYLVHKYKKEGDPGFGQKVQCSAIHGTCPLCATGDKAKPRWLLGVISRKDNNTYKILDISFAVFSQIRKLAKNPKKGDPTKYDVNVEVDKNGGALGYYSVQSYDKEPLSAADQVIKDSVDLDDLKRRVTPPTADKVQQKIDKINGTVTDGGAVAGKKTAKVAAPKVASTPTVSMTDDEEMDKSFPPYDGDQPVS